MLGLRVKVKVKVKVKVTVTVKVKVKDLRVHFGPFLRADAALEAVGGFRKKPRFLARSTHARALVFFPSSIGRRTHHPDGGGLARVQQRWGRILVFDITTTPSTLKCRFAMACVFLLWA